MPSSPALRAAVRDVALGSRDECLATRPGFIRARRRGASPVIGPLSEAWAVYQRRPSSCLRSDDYSNNCRRASRKGHEVSHRAVVWGHLEREGSLLLHRLGDAGVVVEPA